ncbi:MAG: glycoside hydrolase family 3 N-terminal domain-containing protein [Thermoleophilia bacterium]
MVRHILPIAALALIPTMAVSVPTDAQLAGQRVVWPVDGTFVSAAMRAGITRGEVGSIIVFGRNARSPSVLKRLTTRLQAIPRPEDLDVPLLIMIDQEGGLVTRIPSVPPTSAAAVMGANLTPAQIRAQGVATGRGLMALGVNTDLAPVCDVAVRGGDIFRDRRSFGTIPARVGDDCTAFAQGLAAGGTAAAAKHFPGFGRARVNTDNAPVRIGATRAALSRDLAPFRQAIRAGVPMVLVSSAIYPALAPQPAMLSTAVIGGLLRGQLGFRGVTISDAVDAAALKPWGGTRGASARAAVAGMDLLITSGTEAAAMQAQRGVIGALASGALARSDALASVRRVIALRRDPAG